MARVLVPGTPTQPPCERAAVAGRLSEPLLRGAQSHCSLHDTRDAQRPVLSDARVSRAYAQTRRTSLLRTVTEAPKNATRQGPRHCGHWGRWLPAVGLSWGCAEVVGVSSSWASTHHVPAVPPQPILPTETVLGIADVPRGQNPSAPGGQPCGQEELLGEAHEPALNSRVLGPSGADQEGRRAPCAPSPQPPMARFQPAAPLCAASPAGFQPRSKPPKQHTTSLWLAQTQPCKKPGDVHMPCPYPRPYQDTLSRPRRGRRSSYPGHPEHPNHHGSQATRGLGASAHPHTCSPSEGGSGTGRDTKLPTLQLGSWWEKIKRMRNQI
nr:uncharacterized protein LOC110581151 [Neomonachus schauinslandi]